MRSTGGSPTCDRDGAWQRLVDPDAPAISFQLLPIEDMGSGEDLYIKMNSRGKPLTPFENFKARFESAMAWVRPQGPPSSTTKIDGSGPTCSGAYRGDDDIVDDEFLRYFTFVTELCQWRIGELSPAESASRAAPCSVRHTRTTGRSKPRVPLRRVRHLAGADIGDEIGRLFATSRGQTSPQHPTDLLFGTEPSPTCSTHAAGATATARFTYGRRRCSCTRCSSTAPQHPRGLPAAASGGAQPDRGSESELRRHRLPALVADVRRIVVDGSLDDIDGFNQAQAEDEQPKRRS